MQTLSKDQVLLLLGLFVLASEDELSRPQYSPHQHKCNKCKIIWTHTADPDWGIERYAKEHQCPSCKQEILEIHYE
jgi:hypothetical protein